GAQLPHRLERLLADIGRDRHRADRSERRAGCHSVTGRAQMFAHSSHTPWGMTPARMSRANAWQPRHRPNADSRNAAAASAPVTIQAAVGAPANASTAAVVENV